MTNRYHSSGFKSVSATSYLKAAEIFAARQARRDYGKRGICRHVRLGPWSLTGPSLMAEAYIGVKVPDGGCSGHNINILITKI